MSQAVEVVKVFIGITGLGGFVPLPTDSAAGRPERVANAVLFVDAQSRHGVSSHNADHFTGILVEAKFEPRAEDWRERIVQDDEKEYFFFRVSRKRIWLEDSRRLTPRGLLVNDCGAVDLHTECPSPELCSCFDWVAPMRAVVDREVEPIEDSVFEGTVDNVLELREGYLTAGSLGKTKDGYPPLWSIERGAAKDFRRAMAESVVSYQEVVPDAEGRIALCLCSLDHGVSETVCRDRCDQRLTLKPDGDEVWLYIKNQPRQRWFPAPNHPHAIGTRNGDFQHLYRPLKGPAVNIEPPRVVANCTYRCSYPPVLPAPGGLPVPAEVLEKIASFLSLTANNVQCPGADFGGG